jgi:hypothetical protein
MLAVLGPYPLKHLYLAVYLYREINLVHTVADLDLRQNAGVKIRVLGSLVIIVMDTIQEFSAW